MSILGGFLRQTQGSVEIFGWAEPWLIHGGKPASLRQRLGYVPQNVTLDLEITGEEALELMTALYGVKRQLRGMRVKEQAAACGLAEVLRRRIGTWSGGLKQRLHLAASLIHEPELLLLDEPTAGLDAEGTSLFWQDLRRRNRNGNTVLVATHDLEAVSGTQGDWSYCSAGKSCWTASPQDLPRLHGEADLTALFLHLGNREPGNRRGQKKGPCL